MSGYFYKLDRSIISWIRINMFRRDDQLTIDREEGRIVCPNCGKRVPAMVYCIYCGTRLPKPVPRTVPPPPPAAPAPSRAQLPVPSPIPSRIPPPARFPPSVPPPPPPPVKDEIQELMSNITKYYERKVSLLEMLRQGEVSERVFLKLYNEYTEKVNDLLNTRIRKVEGLRRDLEEKNKRFEDVSFTLEELEVRHKIGEIDDQRFAEKSGNLRGEESRLQTTVKDLKAKLSRLDKMFADKAPHEILTWDKKVRDCYEALDRLVEEGRLSRESLGKIKPDMEETLSFLDSIIGERKEKEKKLREQLETLQARYRVSEISIEEYERKKREIQDEISKIWV